jgi:predicted adenine nucleotide alpha hydrolase (AANH) superfamily ATPase
MKQNYQLILDKIIKEECAGKRPSLLLHACCAPCSSYVLEYLSEYFDITLFFYNPNISPKEENDFRADELVRLVKEMGLSDKVKLVIGEYEPQKFNEIAKGLEELPEGGARCAKCYELRLNETAQKAAEGGYDFFTTTLSISPYKNAEWLNSIGAAMGEKYGVRYLISDFKKRNGYKRSCELSAEYGLYRQDFCGCEYSKK